MSYLPLLKNAHILLALVSGIGFALRGYVRIVMDRPLNQPFVRIAPHIVDTFLLLTGVTMWIIIGWPLFSWLGLKLTLVVLYIVVAFAAVRSGHSPRGVLLYLAALGIFLAIAAIALYKPL
ncbi:MAG: SirB2 family protein [Wenzhouxiangella sp.]